MTFLPEFRDIEKKQDILTEAFSRTLAEYLHDPEAFAENDSLIRDEYSWITRYVVATFEGLKEEGRLMDRDARLIATGTFLAFVGLKNFGELEQVGTTSD